MTAARYWHRLTGQRVLCTNIPPEIHAYLDRADLYKNCATYLVVDTQPRDRLFRSAQSYKLLEVTAISGDPASNDKDMTNAVRRMKHILDRWYRGERIGQLCTLLSEIASNITHSLDHGYAIMQRYAEPGSGGSRVHVGIADMGIGIQASLARRHPNLQNELQVGSQYILKALEMGMSGAENTRGIGLTRVQAIVESWPGTLTIRSQHSSVTLAPDGTTLRDDLVGIPGVQIFIRVQDSSLY